ncbi:MAG: hypothetical protein F2694_02845 [Actinobacteria bacterium]|uniref:Unannotated protein n=1 Tax=freshwater metagenome TaxID=449393 RepID=A0A6J6SK06_9ZZZZ|nr:hypothetical protein [Actinomycetota bacterium]
MADQFAEKFRPKPKSGPVGQITELKDLVAGYAKQQTVDPLKTLGRYLGYGFAGSMVMGLGFFLLLLALLRGLQEFTVFNDPTQLDGGTFSWAPYFITATAGTVLVVLFLWRLIVNLNKHHAASAHSA